CTACSSSRSRSPSSRSWAASPPPRRRGERRVNPTDAVSLIRETFGVEPVVDGPTVTVALPVNQWKEVVAWAKATLGGRYFHWLSAGDWKAEALEGACGIANP